MKMKIQQLFFILLIGVASCNHSEKDKLIPREDFVNLLVELHLYDEVITDFSLSSQIGDIDSLRLYSSILKEFNTNKSSFEATLLWYSNKPEELADIYNEVFGILTKQEEVLANTLKLFSSKQSKIIWEQDNFLQLLGDTVHYPKPFVIPVDTLGTYLFDIRLRMLTDDASESPFLNIYFCKDEADTVAEDRLDVVRVPLYKSNFARDFDYFYELTNDEYKFVKIIIPDTPSRGKRVHKSMQLSRLKVLRRNENVAELITKTKK
jgi:hypothetical protein